MNTLTRSVRRIFQWKNDIIPVPLKDFTDIPRRNFPLNFYCNGDPLYCGCIYYTDKCFLEQINKRIIDRNDKLYIQ